MALEFIPITQIEDPEVVAELTELTQGQLGVADDQTATKLLLRIAAKDAAVAALDAQYRAMRERFKKEAGSFRAWCEPQLAAYAKSQLKPGKKSHHTLGGTLSFRTVASAYSVANEEKALAFAQEHIPDAVILVPTLDKKVFTERAKLIYDQGIVVPGMEIKPERESFSIKIASKTEEAD